MSAILVRGSAHFTYWWDSRGHRRPKFTRFNPRVDRLRPSNLGSFSRGGYPDLLDCGDLIRYHPSAACRAYGSDCKSALRMNTIGFFDSESRSSEDQSSIASFPATCRTKFTAFWNRRLISGRPDHLGKCHFPTWYPRNVHN